MKKSQSTEVSELRRAINDLSVLNDIANAINISMSTDNIARTIVERCAKHLRASQGAIFLLSDESKGAEEFKTYIRSLDSSRTDMPLHLDKYINLWMKKNRDLLICNNPNSDPRFAHAKLEDQGISAILAVPLLERGHLIGALVMFNKKEGKGFDENDSRLLSIVGS